MKVPFAGPTQKFLDIVDIKEDTLILKGPRFCMVLETSSLNFDLLSEKEQDASIFAYANFVNSLEEPVQVIVRTRQVEIEKYLDFLEEQKKIQPSEALRENMESYIQFVHQLVLESTILTKRFFIVIPYRQSSTQSKSLLDPLAGIFPGLEPPSQSQYKEEDFKKAQQEFNEKEKEISWHFRRLGLEVNRLKTSELIKLFFKIYNPDIRSEQLFSEDTEGYFAPVVKAAVN